MIYHPRVYLQCNYSIVFTCDIPAKSVSVIYEETIPILYLNSLFSTISYIFKAFLYIHFIFW